jgi:hypothetical protein
MCEWVDPVVFFITVVNRGYFNLKDQVTFKGFKVAPGLRLLYCLR